MLAGSLGRRSFFVVVLFKGQSRQEADSRKYARAPRPGKMVDDTRTSSDRKYNSQKEAGNKH